MDTEAGLRVEAVISQMNLSPVMCVYQQPCHLVLDVKRDNSVSWLIFVLPEQTESQQEYPVVSSL